MTFTIWLTGLSGSGKTTIATSLQKILSSRKEKIVLLDGDIIRQMISFDLNKNRYGGQVHTIRIANMCYIINSNDISCVVCSVSPDKNIRKYARVLNKSFVEVYLKCPNEICNQREIKGYKKDEITEESKGFIGINVPYEEPDKPELIIETDKLTIKESVTTIINYLEKQNIVKVDYDIQKS